MIIQKHYVCNYSKLTTMAKHLKIIASTLLVCLGMNGFAQQSTKIPHLQKKGTATQLIVDGNPFLILGGELGNSSSSNTDYMNSIWPTLETLNLNTILAPVYWELVEPQEGKFDFSIVNDLILGARARDIKLILLWFGSWKNSMSCYAPAWVKNDYERFPRARDNKNKPVEILSPFVKANVEADRKAFTEFMKFVKEVDGEKHTVIMVQVENEIGMLPFARDNHPEANKAFSSEISNELAAYLKKNKENLMPEFRSVWEKNGSKTKGNWKEVFGDNIATEEIFMAWYFGKYVEEIISAGKAEYNLPMYVNAALNRPNKLPGEYPSAGPLPHLMDIWKAAAHSIDILAPDIYFADYRERIALYDRATIHCFCPKCATKVFQAPKVTNLPAVQKHFMPLEITMHLVLVRFLSNQLRMR